MRKIFCIFILIFLISPNICFAEDKSVIDLEKDELGITNFLNETKKYSESFSEFDYNKIFNDSVSGKFDTDLIFDKIYSLVRSRN